MIQSFSPLLSVSLFKINAVSSSKNIYVDFVLISLHDFELDFFFFIFGNELTWWQLSSCLMSNNGCSFGFDIRELMWFMIVVSSL